MKQTRVDTFLKYHHLEYMLSCPNCANNAIPEEYRSIALDLFPPEGYAEGKSPTIECIKNFAQILGLGRENLSLISALKSGRELENLLASFQNNLDLLIQKTWVEKSEESRKENLLDRLPAFIAGIEQEKYPGILEEFGEILEELAWLFFGNQSRKDDFTEYTLRIDTQMGLFWWYGNQLCSTRALEWIKKTDVEILKAILFLGICFLTNF
ncbi:MAG: hypothetical protein FWD78_14555 [Treponema sp.]|nr:hypothetical protein [Treponema sp.]